MEQKKPIKEDKDKRHEKKPNSDAAPIIREKRRNSLGPDILWEELP